jgi:hypothetical protein
MEWVLGERERAIGPARRMEKGSDAFRAKEALTGREQGESRERTSYMIPSCAMASGIQQKKKRKRSN